MNGLGVPGRSCTLDNTLFAMVRGKPTLVLSWRPEPKVGLLGDVDVTGPSRYLSFFPPSLALPVSVLIESSLLIHQANFPVSILPFHWQQSLFTYSFFFTFMSPFIFLFLLLYLFPNPSSDISFFTLFSRLNFTSI